MKQKNTLIIYPLLFGIMSFCSGSLHFTQEKYFAYVPENIPEGKSILKIQAEHLHDNAIMTIRYNFSSPPNGPIGIDSNTGEIYSTEIFDYEKIKQINVRVEATDGITVSHALVLMDIIDLNDNSPIILLNTLTDDNKIHVTENEHPGTAVANFAVNDADSAKNGQVNCQIDNPKFKLRALPFGEYLLEAKYVLDRELDAFEGVVITCKDNGYPQRVSSHHLMITVDDVNDNVPHFMQRKYDVSLEENNHPGVYIVRVRAADPDEGINAELRFSLSGSGCDVLRIDPVTGLITAKYRFDYEVMTEVVCNVAVRDSGHPFLSSQTTLTVSILDQEDA